MRIAFLVPATFALSGRGNGVRIQGLCQAEALRRLGHEVVLVNAWDIRDPAEYDVVQFFMGGLGLSGVEGSRSRAPGRLVFAPIIDSNEPFWKYRMAARLGEVVPARVFTVQGELRRQAVASDLVICRSHHERERVVRGLGAGAEKCAIVLNGVDPPPPADPDRVRARLGLPREFALHVSAYTQGRKNVERLVEAVGPTGIELVIAGTAEPGPALDRLEALARRYRNVRLLGWQDRETLYDLYAACKVFCLPSTHEGTGLVALEAAAVGARVVITERGGPPDYFGEWAYYVDPTSTEGIRSAVRRAWDAPASDALRNHVLANLTWDQSARSLVEAYGRAGSRRK